jgi:uncharacterized phage protein (TIGR01671 family)
MREIKFRAWLGGVMHPVWKRVDDGVYETHPDIKIMQYTGLKDKNGKEIYEGDIIKETTKDDKGEEIVSEVKFYDGIFGDDTMDGWTLKELVDEFGAYVIGNIYENPELLNN